MRNVQGLAAAVSEKFYTDHIDDDIYNEARARPLAEKAAPLSRMFRNVGNTPLSQRIEEKKRGIARQRYPYVGEYSLFLTFL